MSVSEGGRTVSRAAVGQAVLTIAAPIKIWFTATNSTVIHSVHRADIKACKKTMRRCAFKTAAERTAF